MTSTTVTHSDGGKIHSSVFIIAQSDTRNKDYFISWFQKIVLEQLLFNKGTFSEPLVFKGIYFSEITNLFVLQIATFLNFRE